MSDAPVPGIPAEAARACGDALEVHYDTVSVHKPGWLCCAQAALEAVLPVLAAHARAQARRETAQALRGIAASPGICRSLIDRHPSLQSGLTLTGVLTALADEIENPPANERTANA